VFSTSSLPWRRPFALGQQNSYYREIRPKNLFYLELHGEHGSPKPCNRGASVSFLTNTQPFIVQTFITFSHTVRHKTLFTYTNNISPLLGGSHFGFPIANLGGPKVEAKTLPYSFVIVGIGEQIPIPTSNLALQPDLFTASGANWRVSITFSTSSSNSLRLVLLQMPSFSWLFNCLPQ